MNDFFPAIVSVAILASVFLFAFLSDLRRMRQLRAPKRPWLRARSDEEIEQAETAQRRWPDAE